MTGQTTPPAGPARGPCARTAPPVALLVLGAGVRRDGTASPALDRRTRHAARLWHRGAASVIVPCGGTGRHPPAEAEVMTAILREAGVPASCIHPEARSTSTAQNIRFAKPILARLGITSVVIVSDAYHLPRARLLARRAGLSATGSAPPRSGPVSRARTMAQMRAILREVPAFLAALVGVSR